MKKIITAIIAILLVLATMLPCLAENITAGTGTEETRWVNALNGKKLNVREHPEAGAKIITRLECGTQITAVHFDNTPKGWIYITAKKGNIQGWVKEEFTVTRKPGKYEITEKEDNIKPVTAFAVRALAVKGHPGRSVGLRTQPNKGAKAIRTLAEDDILTVLAQGKIWSKVKDQKTGKIGFIANDYIVRV